MMYGTFFGMRDVLTIYIIVYKSCSHTLGTCSYIMLYRYAVTYNFVYPLLLERLKQLERGFVLDGVTLSRHANDEIGRTNPSLNFAIPQYNASDDPHCKSYFKMKGLPKTAKVAANKAKKDDKRAEGDTTEHTSTMMGAVFDKFVRNSSAKQYISDRASIGAGVCINFVSHNNCA